MSPVATRMPSLPAPRRAEEFARLLESGAGSIDRPLLSMLTVARGLQSLPTDGAPSEEFRAALRKRLVAVAAVQAQAGPAPAASQARAWAGSWRGWQGQRKIAVLSGSLAALVAVAGVAVGASRSLPGDPLYGVKKGTEAAQLFVTSGDVDRGNRHLDYARTRLQEISDLLKPGSALGGGALGQPLAAAPAAGSLPGRLTEALKDMDSDTLDGSRDLTEAFRDQHDRGALLTLRSFATQQHHELAGLLPAFPAAAKPRAELSLGLLTAVHQRAQQLLDTGACTGACAQATPGHTGEDRLGVLPCDCAGPAPAQPGPTTPLTPAPSATSGDGSQPSGQGPVPAPSTTSSAPNPLSGSPGVQDPTGVGDAVDRLLGGGSPLPTPGTTIPGGLPGTGTGSILPSPSAGSSLPLPLPTTSPTSTQLPLPLPLPGLTDITSGTTSLLP